MVSFPLALAFGITGLARDTQKLLAVVCTVVAGGFVLFYLYMAGFLTFCR